MAKLRFNDQEANSQHADSKSCAFGRSPNRCLYYRPSKYENGHDTAQIDLSSREKDPIPPVIVRALFFSTSPSAVSQDRFGRPFTRPNESNSRYPAFFI